MNRIHLFDFANINSTLLIEEKLTKFTDAVSSAHNLSSKPITNTRHSYTPQHIKELIARKNRARKIYQRALNPVHKFEANRLQGLLKKVLRIYTQCTWTAKLASLETQDNSLRQMKKHFRKKRSNIPNLTSSSGIASNDEQKANLIANTFIDNYTENKIPASLPASTLTSLTHSGTSSPLHLALLFPPLTLAKSVTTLKD
ncbi:hypothetical protein TNCV_2429881 [Trichonephila clavipes]|nr:hypothetical protein TNCV_2429881 [Trichonephila clavipes]